jgi:hypothetical protein
MKQIIFLLALAGILAFSGCTKSYVDGFDKSPNDPSSVQLSNLVTATQVSVIGNVTGELARTSSIFMQSQAGISNQSATDIAVYKLGEGDNVNDYWSVYTDWMETANNIIIQAGDENPYYKGIGLVLHAWGGAYTSDIWGNVPFSKALKALDNLNPEFDSQESIYNQAQSELSQAIQLFSKSEDSNKLLPGADDIYYNGDVGAWTKLAWALKARYFNRVSLRYSYSADSVLACISHSFTSTDDNLYAKFGTIPSNVNQWYGMYLQRQGYMAMGEFFVNRLKLNNDPRLPFYANVDPTSGYSGSPADTRAINLDASPIGPFFVGLMDVDGAPTVSDMPLEMVSYEELLFLSAEAKLRANNPAGAAADFNEAVITSVSIVTGSNADAAFVTAQASKDAGNIDLKTIIEGKYDAMFTQVEVWTDWRRTGFPNLVANQDPKADSKGIPLRFPTIIDERLYNSNAQAVQDNYEKLWFMP